MGDFSFAADDRRRLDRDGFIGRVSLLTNRKCWRWISIRRAINPAVVTDKVVVWVADAADKKGSLRCGVQPRRSAADMQVIRGRNLG